jgi:uncharacterized membrane protein
MDKKKDTHSKAEAPPHVLPPSKPPAKKLSINTMDLEEINKKLADVLDLEENILKEEKHVEAKETKLIEKEKRIEEEEHKIERAEKPISKIARIEQREESDLEKLERLEKEIKDEVGVHPLVKITYKDVIKGFVGAFIGLVVHYTFTYGVEIAGRISDTRATLLYIISFFVGILFIYATGFRKVKDPKVLAFMPIRLIVLYGTSLIACLAVLLIFYPDFGDTFMHAYKLVAALLIAAIIGSCTADLIGKE